MYRIVKKEPLNPSVTRMSIEAPLVAKKVQPGQFIILRAEEDGERIPLTVAGYDREAGTVDIIFQIVGATTEKLNHKQQGECIPDFVGPLGKPTETEGLKRVAVIGGGVGVKLSQLSSLLGSSTPQGVGPCTKLFAISGKFRQILNQSNKMPCLC